MIDEKRLEEIRIAVFARYLKSHEWVELLDSLSLALKVVRAAQELWNCKEAGNGFCGKHLNDLETALAPFAASEGKEEKQ